MRADDPSDFTESRDVSVPSGAYSAVRVQEIAYDGPDLNPIPSYLVGETTPDGVDPQEIIGSGQDGFMIGIHSTGPDVGTGEASSLTSLIGLTVRRAGAFSDVAVPILPHLTSIRAGQTMPPRPGRDGVSLTAVVWRFTDDPVPVPRRVTIDGDPLQTSATMTAELNRNDSVPVFVAGSPDWLTPDSSDE